MKNILAEIREIAKFYVFAGKVSAFSTFIMITVLILVIDVSEIVKHLSGFAKEILNRIIC